MDTNGSLYLQAKSQLIEYLEKRHMRKTPERFEVLGAICQMDDIFSIEQLGEKMRMCSSFQVSRVTLFNTLETFVDAQLVIKHTLQRASLYEKNIDKRPRVCMVCNQCGLVKRLDKIEVTRFLNGIKTRQFFVRQPVLYLHGLCRKCEMAKRKEIKMREKKLTTKK